jgi:O-antigen ligase
MQNITPLAASDSLPLDEGLSQSLRDGVAVAVLLVVFVTLTPFSDLGDPKLLELSSGNETATYLALFLLLGAAGLLLRRTAGLMSRSLATTENLLLLAWLLVVSVAFSIDPGVSARRFVLSFATFLLAAMLPWLTRGLKHFTVLMLGIAALVLVLSYLGVLLVPHLTIHQANDLIEPEIAGDWRGIYGHKNAAAGMMAVFVYVGWFAARTGRPIIGVAISIAALVFLVGSGGKSAIGMLFVVALIAVLVDRARSLPARALAAFGPLALIGFLTVGSITSEAARALLSALPIDVTFTGRTEIWSFAIDALAAHPWKGQGFEAFWYSDAVRFGAEDSTKWMVDVATSHNSYVDLALTIGMPGLGLVVWAFLAAPLRDFHRRLDTVPNAEFARFFLVLWLFSLYLGTFEAFFLSRVSPMWFVFAMAVCGLRFTARFEVKD